MLTRPGQSAILLAICEWKFHLASKSPDLGAIWRVTNLELDSSFLFTTEFIPSWTIVLQGWMSCVCMCMSPSFMDFHDGITFECIEIESWILLHSTPNIILFHCRTLHDCRIIILAKIANLTLFYYVIFMDFHDGISFDGIKLDGWNLLQSAFNLILLHKWTRHDCQIISLACIM